MTQVDARATPLHRRPVSSCAGGRQRAAGLTGGIRALLTQHALPQAAQLHVCRVEGLGRAPVQRLLLAVDHDGAALLQDPLGGPFHHHEETLVTGVVCLVYGELRGKGVEHVQCGIGQ